jgi:hypothetical protein
MKFKELERWMSQQQTTTEQSNPALDRLLQKVRNKPFYWNAGNHKDPLTPKINCCFNHTLGLPVKGNKVHQLYNYENQIFRALTEPAFINTRPSTEEDNIWYEEQRILLEQGKNVPKGESIDSMYTRLLKEKANRLIYPQKAKHVAILKSSGLGITEFTLRFILWLCLKDDNLKGSQICIIVGPRIELAVSLINRLKDLLKPHGIIFTDKETVLNLNGVHIEAFPSHHVDSARGLPNISLIFADEAAFFPDKEVDNVMDIMLRNIPKSNPYLICVSTANKPGDLMDNLFNHEDFETSIWKQIRLDYRWGINTIYDQEEIDKIRNSRSFEREFNLKFAGVEGNVLSPVAIDRCISLGEPLAKTADLDDWNIQTKYVMSVDVGWGLSKGSSNTAIVVSRFVNGKVQIIYSTEFTQPDFRDMIDEIWRLFYKCNGRDYLKNILVDASATELYTALCNEFDQNSSGKYLETQMKWCKERNVYLGDHLFICPIPFNPQGKYMLNHTQRMIEFQEDDGGAIVGIHNSFGDLIASCRSSYATGDKLDKTKGAFADSFDSLLMNLSWYVWSK